MKHVAKLYGIPYFDGPVVTGVLDDRFSRSAERRFWMDALDSGAIRLTLEDGAEIFIPQEILKTVVVVIKWLDADD